MVPSRIKEFVSFRENFTPDFQDISIEDYQFLTEDELEDLRKVDATSVCTFVQFGSVVITNKMNFFVSVSIENFEVGEKPFYQICDY